jgi:twinkle protein
MATIIPDDIDFNFYLHETEAQSKVKPASTWIADIKDRLRNHASERRIFLPWEKTGSVFNFRNGEVTVWVGQNGHGKSLITSQVALSLMAQGEKVCIASFEMKPQTTIQRMARMFTGTNPFSPEYQSEKGIEALDELYDDFGKWTDERLWLYDQMGTTDAGTVIGMARYCAKELKINHIFIDSLMKCVQGEDDYNGQKMFVDECTAIAKDYQCHIHLVHHQKKPKDEHAKPDKHDTKGSGAITDMVDNLMMVWRNKAKEELIKTGKPCQQDEADQMIYCKKQRNGEDEPTIGLWFNKDAMQFVGNYGDPPMAFQMEYPHRWSTFG